MKEVIEKLRRTQQGYLVKADAIDEAIKVLLNGDPEFDVTKVIEDDQENLVRPLAVHPANPLKFIPRKQASLAFGSLRDVVLDMIEEHGPTDAIAIAALLQKKFSLAYEGRKMSSIRSSVSGTLTYLRKKKPKVRNLKWEKKGKSYTYWFAGKR